MFGAVYLAASYILILWVTASITATAQGHVKWSEGWEITKRELSETFGVD